MYFVYMITNWRNSVLYTGMTNDLERRMYEHKNKLIDGFSKKYNCNKLVYFDSTASVSSAIEREKEIKGWARKRKNALVNQSNPQWLDLAKGWPI